jgi:hypothetical protein
MIRIIKSRRLRKTGYDESMMEEKENKFFLKKTHERKSPV